jgi:hypothetical protein
MSSNRNIPVYGTLLGIAGLFFATFLVTYFDMGI